MNQEQKKFNEYDNNQIPNNQNNQMLNNGTYQFQNNYNFNAQGNNGMLNEQQFQNDGSLTNNCLNRDMFQNANDRKQLVNNNIAVNNNEFNSKIVSQTNIQQIVSVDSKISSKNSKKPKLIISILIIIVLIIISFVIVFLIPNKENNVKNELNKHQTYKKIYSTSENVVYYSNDEEKIYSFLGYNDLDKYIYNNVTCGSDVNYKYFLIDINKKYVVEPGTYDYISRQSEKFYRVVKDKKIGVIDYKGNVIIPTMYSSINYKIENGVEYFIADSQTNNEYYLFSSNGSLLIKTSKSINSLNIRAFHPICAKCSETILYDETLYDTSNGKVLLKDLDGSFYYNFYYKERKLIVYDENYKVKKEVENFTVDAFEMTDDGYPSINGPNKFYLNEKLELIDFNKETEINQQKFIKENKFVEFEGANYHVLDNKEKYITKVDESINSIIIYDNRGNKLKSVEVDNAKDIKRIYSLGDHLIVQTVWIGSLEILDINRNFNLEVVRYVRLLGNGVILGEKKTGDVLFGEKFRLEFNKDYNFYMYDSGFWAYNSKEKKAYFYNLNGELKKEFKGIKDMSFLADDYFLFIHNDGTNKVVNAETGNISFEYMLPNYNSSYYIPYSYLEDNIGVIETSDGIYSLEGKKLIDKNSKDVND